MYIARTFEVKSTLSLQSGALGRPMSVALNHVDCELPRDDEPSTGENGDAFRGCKSHDTILLDLDVISYYLQSDWKWKHSFSQQVYAQWTDALLSAKAPSYETVLDFDRRIRQNALLPVKLYLKPDEADYSNPAICMKSWLMSQYRSIGKQICRKPFSCWLIM